MGELVVEPLVKTDPARIFRLQPLKELLVFILTGRRRSEVMDLKASDITIEDSTVYYSYRGKGGKRGRRELPRPAWEAIRRTLTDCGRELATMRKRSSV